MEKPVKPIAPDASDRKKYPQFTTSTVTVDSPFVRDYKQYKKELAKYEIAMELWQQTKFIEDIQRSTMKLCLKKYRITKK